MASQVTIRLPEMHPKQREMFWWMDEFPKANVLVAPAATKFGKTLGASTWLLAEALSTPNLYCAWIAPTYQKCRIAYRYMKAMLPDIPSINAVDGKLEITITTSQGVTLIKFMHGRDAEVTVEGEAIDRFVIDEAGKISKQVWFSLFTTITQTDGRGIITGTPRGFTWFYDIFKKAKEGDPFFCWKQFITADSPYVKQAAIDRARRLLPPTLFQQYYLAQFVSAGSCFGDMSQVWLDPTEMGVVPGARLWLHPDLEQRKIPVVHGVDWAKIRDYTVFFSTNVMGQLAGLYRLRGGKYPEQVNRLRKYTQRFGEDQMIKYDQTGVGEAVGDIMAEADINADIDGVHFTNKWKQEMVTRVTIAMETGYFRAPRITTMEHEFSTYEVSATKMGYHTYKAPDGEHDDIVSAALLSVGEVYSSGMAEEAEIMLEDIIKGDDLEDYIDVFDDHEVDLDKDMEAVDPDELDDLLAYED